MADRPEPLPVLDALHSTPARRYLLGGTETPAGAGRGALEPVGRDPPTREQLLTALDGVG